MIFDLGDQLNRVQCKWAGVNGDVVIVRCHSARRTGAGLVRRLYSADQIDSFAAYCAELDRCFWLPIAEFPGRSLVHLRLQHSRNNQRRRINWADDFDFAARLGGDQGGRSSAGRASGWQPEGHGFEPRRLHPKPSSLRARKTLGLAASRGSSAHLTTRTSTHPTTPEKCPQTEKDRARSPPTSWPASLPESS
jgi:PD-(D/E)XK nuclease superfamily protein